MPTPTETPGEVAGVAATIADTPTEVPGVTTKMSAYAAAGLELSKRVLLITAGAILILTVYLAWIDRQISADIQSLYGNTESSPRLGLEIRTLAQFDQLSTDLRAAQVNPSAWPSAAQQNASDVVALLERVPSIGATARAEIAACAPPPAANAVNRAQIVQTCITRIDALRHEGLESAQRAIILEAAGEAATKLNEQRVAQHTFWIQGAQLILLNLLLPLLTALFGYVFGTQSRS